MHIQKVLNSSVVLVQDDSGEEAILLARASAMDARPANPLSGSPQTVCSFRCPTRMHSPCWSCFPAFRRSIWI